MSPLSFWRTRPAGQPLAMQDNAMGSPAISSSHNYIVKKTSIEERGLRSSSCTAAMDRLACGDDECDNRSTHSVDGSFESFSRTSSCQASSAARQAHRTMSHETMSSSDADGESFGSGSLEDTFSGTDDAFSEDGEEGDELSAQRRYLQTLLTSKLRKIQDAAGLEDGVAESSNQADQAFRKNIITL
mmetsp:Transcript_12615/g.32406  ORF Transcript_12615/g.32406 Transcript_12615/m.32406 type:complete len:187 (+) Transcript_12615:49-609(+)